MPRPVDTRITSSIPESELARKIMKLKCKESKTLASNTNFILILVITEKLISRLRFQGIG